jgi:transcriptional regulator with XRE-family HTH domain
MKYPHFAKALRALGKTDRECAQALGVSRGTFYNYLRGVSLPSVEKVKLHPTLDHALTLDIRGETGCECAHIPA